VVESERSTPLASQVSGLRLRLISAMVLAPMALVPVWLGGLIYAGVLAIVGVLALFEWGRLTAAEAARQPGLVQIPFLVGALLLGMAGRYDVSAVALLAGVAVAVTVALASRRSPLWAVLAPIYVGVPLVCLLWLRTATGAGVIFFLLALVWASDSAAFVTGKLFKGPKLAPRISPNKTWAGAIGGLVGAALVGAVAAPYVDFSRTGPLVLVALGLSIIGQLGDLAESGVKRHFGAKDSGALIPGHGGLLDRMDSLFFVAPAAVLWLVWHNGG